MTQISFFSMIAHFLFPWHFSEKQPSNDLQIKHLTGDFYVYTTYQSYKGNRTPANGVYLVTSDGIAMIDTPWDTTQFQPLADHIQKAHQKKVVLCISTHSHDDRTAGLAFFAQQGAKTYSSLQTKLLCEQNGNKKAAFTFSKDTVFKLGAYLIETYYPGAGHTKDNITIWFPKEKLLYGGCFIKSTESTDLGYIKEGDVKEWPKSLNRVKTKYQSPKFVIPGHGSWSDVKSIEHTLMLLKENEGKMK